MRDDKRGGVTPLVAVMMGPELPSLIEADRRPLEDEAIRALDFLLGRGVSPTIANDLGTTAMHLAALRDYPAVIRYLAEKGVNLNVADKEGFTPLDYAQGHAHSKMRFVKPPPSETAAAAELRKLGAQGKGEQRTAAR